MDKEASPPSIPPASCHVNVVGDGVAGDVKSGVKVKAKGGLREIMHFATKWELVLNGIGLVAACAAGATQPLMTLLFGNLTTSFLQYAASSTEEERNAAIDHLKSDIDHDALLLVYIGVAMFACTYLYMATWVYTGEEITRRMRESYIAAVFRQELAFFDNVGPGEVTTRLQNDMQLIQAGISDKFPSSVMLTATFITGFALAFAKSWQLALAMSAILPCIVVLGIVMNSLLVKYQKIELRHMGEASTMAEEVLSSVRTVKAFAAEDSLVDLYGERSCQSERHGQVKALVFGVGLGGIFFVIYAGYAMAFFFGSELLASGHIESGTVTTVIFSVFIGSFSIALMAPNLEALVGAISASSKVMETINRQTQLDSSSHDGVKLEDCKGNIRFESVHFHYPARPDAPVLEGLNLTMEANNITALVGSSGSGKSTIISLLERFYDPQAGRILLDGVDVKDINIGSLRSQIGLVSQEPTLFSLTVRENIELGLLNTSLEHADAEKKQELVMRAAMQAHAHDFISQLPQGYDTMVGERGLLLSGGQKQRMAIARAIVADPPILLLDEATSALDTLSEAIVQRALESASQSRTTIVVAHRLSTIQKADRIVVMGGGKILEQGTHQSLLNRQDGSYAKLVAAQQIRAAENSGPSLHLDESTARSSSSSTKIDGGKWLEQIDDTIKKEEVSREEPEKQQKKNNNLFYLLYRITRLSERSLLPSYLFGFLGCVVSGAVYPAFTIIFGMALQAFSLCQDQQSQQGSCPEPNRSVMRQHSDRNSLYLFIIALLATVTVVIEKRDLCRVADIVAATSRRASLSALLRHEVSFYDDDDHSSGSLASALAERSQKLTSLINATLPTIVQSISTLLVGWIIALAYSWRLALPLIATAPLTLSAGICRLQLVILKDEKVNGAHREAARQVCEAMVSIRTVAALTMEKRCKRLYSQQLQKPASILFRTAIYGNLLFALSQALAFPTIAFGFWYGSRLLFDGHIGISAFFTALSATIFASIQAGNAFSFVSDVSQGQRAAQDIVDILDSETATDAAANTLPDCQGHVTFEGVHFRYPTRKQIPVLQGLSLVAKPGSTCALVGQSGCGKSTTLQLLERFYDVDRQGGRLLIDGHDVRTIDPASLRQHMAYVGQEPMLFDGTIGWNIALGAGRNQASQVTDAQIRKAAQDANILAFVEGLSDGFETQVGGRGTQLSGGQKQRIAIARALIRDPKILLLDEATSALDSESEQVVQDALDRASKGRTTIVVAHRVASISRADQIFYLKEGKVAEQGDHRSLMASRGLYFNLVGQQASLPPS